MIKKLKYSFKKIKLVDKCLILIMLILFIQICINLFCNEIFSNNTDPVDIVVRSTAAAIFGYFISVNFIKNESDIKEELKSETKELKTDTSKITKDTSPNIYNNKQIGFLSTSSDEMKSGKIDINNSNYSSNSLQIIIVTLFSVISLIVILIARNYTSITSESTASISQLRDFVCGGVGFLLGYPSDTK